MDLELKPLGRRVPTDWRHLAKYPLRDVAPRTVATVERTLPLPYAYRAKYDQGSEGACVGYALSWAMSIANRRYYDAGWLYREAQRVDEWAGEAYEGTSVRAGCDVLRTLGHKMLHVPRHHHAPEPANGIAENRWAKTPDEIRTAIAAGIPVVLGIDWMSAFDEPERLSGAYWIGRGELGAVRGGHAICAYAASDRRQAIKLVNSWGTSFPLVWLPYRTLETLLDGVQYPGEAAVLLDRPGRES